ncbi:hypothetical protein VSR01_19425 [Actinacidiphila sp. DG2A-62]|uniref:hypothetical protein n=1 Tax=Actinacidiphila sp. DG2A-62 TaxID=3108821 RepID=UPI002DB70BB4|nr:hypothetical protein [Actinacidiphila sp. DG2A-62]MEC3995579.1 hypothetical protein [Actinacidiphila sp. DG2A-62]
MSPVADGADAAVPADRAAVRRAGAGVRLLRAALFAAACVVLAGAGHTLASARPVPAWSLVLGWLAVFAFTAPLAGRERTLPGIAGLLAAGELALHAVFSTGQMCGQAAASRAAGAAGADNGLTSLAARLLCGGAGHAAPTPTAAQAVLARAGLDPLSLARTAAAGHPYAADTHGGVPTAMAGMPGMGGAGGGTTGLAHAPAAGLTAFVTMFSLPMLLGHLLAAVVAGWLLRRGEAALWRLLRLSVRGAAGLAALSPAALRRAFALLAALAGTAPGTRLRQARRYGALGRARRPRTVLLRHSLARRGPPAGLAAV